MSAQVLRALLVLVAIAFVSWAAVYWGWAMLSFDDGPFSAEPFVGDVTGLPTLSSVDLRLFGSTLFVLEARATREDEPRAVLMLRRPQGRVRWAKVTAAEFGRIHVVDRPAWFVAGGWVVPIKPERTESGELYLSPFGEFRFFFHSW